METLLAEFDRLEDIEDELSQKMKEQEDYYNEILNDFNKELKEKDRQIKELNNSLEELG